MTDEAPTDPAPETNAGWWIGASFLVVVGSLGPFGVYELLTDPAFLDKFHGWRVLLVPFGLWVLTGLLVSGLGMAWAGGVRRSPEWGKQGDRVWGWWCNVGLWIIGLCVCVAVAAYLFSGLASWLGR